MSIVELTHSSACFEGYFLQAVAMLLPADAQAIVARFFERGYTSENSSPVVEAILHDAAQARRAIVARTFEGDADSYIDTAAERTAARVIRMFEKDNVAPLAPRPR